MRRRLAAPLAALALAGSGLLAGVGARPAAAAVPPPPSAPPQAKAWLLVDADTGAVLQAFSDHIPLRPASTEKIMTGLLAVTALPPDATVPVGADAAGEEAAKINMKAGQVWTLTDALHSLLMVSANDAAVALADKVSGSPAGFSRLASLVARRLGVVDNPVFNDPAGLDDSFAFGGGDFISAWDMAVVTRAAMSEPTFRATVSLPIYDFVGPDGIHHVLRNHNKLLLSDPTLIGVKPGYTVQAGDTYVAEAARNGRDMLVVEFGVSPPTMYSGAEYLFSQGFATPVAAEPSADRLPPVRVPDVAALAASPSAASTPAEVAAGAAHVRQARAVASQSAAHRAAPGSGRLGGDLLRVVLLISALLLAWVVSRRAGVRRSRPVRRPVPAGRAVAAARTRAPVPGDRVPANPVPAPQFVLDWTHEVDEVMAEGIVDWADWEPAGPGTNLPVSPPGSAARRR